RPPLPQPREARRRVGRRPGGLGGPVLPRALAVPRGAADRDGMTRRKALALVCVAVLAAGTGLAFRAFHLLPKLELAAVDARFDARGARTPDRRVVIVGIDDKTLRAQPKDTYPLDRRRHAKVIRNLKAAGAKVIAVDIQFSEPTNVAADNA